LALLVIGFGNTDRGDDAAGVLASRALKNLLPDARVIEQVTDGTILPTLWGRSDRVVVLDALEMNPRDSPRPGEITIFDARSSPLPFRLTRATSHAFGLAEGIELARALNLLPASLTVVAIAGRSFEPGAGLTPGVLEGIERAVLEIAGLSAAT
jgi:hydrogenase maturation protease